MKGAAKKKAKQAAAAADLAGTTNKTLADGSENAAAVYPAFEVPNKYELVAKGKLPAIDENFIAGITKVTGSAAKNFAHTMKGGWEIGKLTKVKATMRTDPTGKQQQAKCEYHFTGPHSSCWFKLRSREYGPAGSANQQWVLLTKKRAAPPATQGGAAAPAAKKAKKRTKK